MHSTRRQFLVDGLRVTALVPSLALTRRARGDSGERVLVVVQLTGGNDGLNMVVPHRQDAYYRLRPTLAQKRAALHALDDDHGLHPALADLRPLFDGGRLTVVQGVGYERPDRSHFRSLEIWHTAELTPSRGIGWLGRMADQILASRPGAMPSLHIGDEEPPLALMGRDVCATSLRDEASLRLDELPTLAAGRQRLLRERSAVSPDLAFLRSSARGAYEAAERLERAVERPARAEYPDLGLARKLSLVARLIEGGFDTRLFLVTLGGFDTHARQAALHTALLEELGRSLSAFERDLSTGGVADRVATLVFSEFGRRAEENASRGTDHGAAGPVLLVGGPGRGLRGSPPDLESLVEGDVAHSLDFRSLYTALEHDWMGLEPSSAVPPLDLSR